MMLEKGAFESYIITSQDCLLKPAMQIIQGVDQLGGELLSRLNVEYKKSRVSLICTIFKLN